MKTMTVDELKSLVFDGPPDGFGLSPGTAYDGAIICITFGRDCTSGKNAPGPYHTYDQKVNSTYRALPLRDKKRLRAALAVEYERFAAWKRRNC